ncbi:calcium-binding protein [Pseudaestuariivita atlantica]|uniref:Peptidase M10 serralysin C-terminal domain-containing protein n=1 Tax=Pseudaestuariivita atlantica TaxID=1317121 RepID=A0A0L1JMD3_9RHOB|nr:calcium-binding protein [Pseudaestuariivita atlantica]KNG92916.1 hypothetical protein ATO11_15810 [Pseudaestuariivita atlantica]
MPLPHTGFLSIVQGDYQGIRDEMNLTPLSDGGYFATWHEANSATDAYDIYGQRFDAQGAPTGDPVILNTEQTDFQRNPDVTQLADGRLVVVWQSFGQEDGFIGTVGYGIFAQLYDVDGTPLGDPIQINTQTRDDQINPNIIPLLDGGFLVHWRETDYPGPEIVLRRFDANADPVGDEFLLDHIGDGPSNMPSLVQAPDGRLLATYQIFDATIGNWDSYLGQFDLSGNSVMTPVLLGENIQSSFNPTAHITMAADGSFVVTLDYTSVNDLYLMPFGADGVATGPAEPVGATYASPPFYPQSTFLPDGRLVLTYSQLFESGSRGVILDSDLTFDGTSYFDVSFGYEWEYGARPTLLEGGALVLQWWNDLILDNAPAHFTQVFFDDPMGSATGFTEGRDTITLPDTGLNVAALGGSDSVTGGADSDTIWGEGANDTLAGRGGDDVLDGGTGADSLLGDAGSDRLYGADGADTLIGGDDGDVLDGGRGTDWLMGGDGADFLTGGGGTDTLDGEAGDDTLLASDTSGSTLSGGLGHDLLIGSTEADMIDGGTGNDTLVGNRVGPLNMGGNETAADTLLGGDGDDFLSGGGAGALLDGGAGNDRLTWGQGTVDGGAGEDTLIDPENLDFGSEFRGTRVDIDLQAGTVDYYDGVPIGTIRNIEHVDLALGDSAADISGTSGNNILIGSNPYTNINGRGGDDYLSGWGVLNGGGGNDTIEGRERDDRLLGGAGDDVLITQVRQDTLYGRDIIRGGDGFDLLVIDPVYNNGQVEYVEVNLATGLIEEHGYWEEAPVLEEVEAVQVLGDLRAHLTGDAGDNLLVGGNLDDTLSGGAGADALIGGAGHDIADYTSATRSVRVDLQNAALSYNDAAGDTFDGIEEFRTGDNIDQLRGDASANLFRTGGLSDRLYGRAGDDTLLGEAGADAFYGGLGADVMTGGDDAGRRDRFIYFNASESGVGDGNRDVITDFVSGEDRIELSRIDADLTQGFKQAFQFIGDTAFSGTAGELRFEQQGGITLVQADRDGDGAADFEIELTGTLTLTSTDFLI